MSSNQILSKIYFRCFKGKINRNWWNNILWRLFQYFLDFLTTHMRFWTTRGGFYLSPPSLIFILFTKSYRYAKFQLFVLRFHMETHFFDSNKLSKTTRDGRNNNGQLMYRFLDWFCFLTFYEYDTNLFNLSSSFAKILNILTILIILLDFNIVIEIK